MGIIEPFHLESCFLHHFLLSAYFSKILIYSPDREKKRLNFTLFKLGDVSRELGNS